MHIYPTLGPNTKIKDLKPKNIAHLWEEIETGKTAERVKKRYERADRQAKKDAEEQGVEYKKKYRQIPKGGEGDQKVPSPKMGESNIQKQKVPSPRKREEYLQYQR